MNQMFRDYNKICRCMSECNCKLSSDLYKLSCVESTVNTYMHLYIYYMYVCNNYFYRIEFSHEMIIINNLKVIFQCNYVIHTYIVINCIEYICKDI